MDTLGIRGPWRRLVDWGPNRKITTLRGVTLIADNESNVGWARAELPKLIWGHNGRLIMNQTELRRAFETLHEELARFCEIPAIEEWNVYRIDFAWQFELSGLSAQAVILAHQSVLVPGIRSAPTLHKGGEGITWTSGKAAGLKIMMYDKSKKMRVPGSVLRVEVSLSKAMLKKALMTHVWYNWNDLYCLYRNVVVSIPSIRLPSCGPGWPEALAEIGLTEKQKALLFASLARWKGKRTVQRYRQRFDAVTFGEDFCWSNQLPENGAPAPVHVERMTSRRRKDAACTNPVDSMPDRRRHHFEREPVFLSYTAGGACDIPKINAVPVGTVRPCVCAENYKIFPST